MAGGKGGDEDPGFHEEVNGRNPYPYQRVLMSIQTRAKAKFYLQQPTPRIADRCVQMKDMCSSGAYVFWESSRLVMAENREVRTQRGGIQGRASRRVQTGLHEYRQGKIGYQGL